jgi:hypothetical protein
MGVEKTDISNIQELLKLLFHNIRGNILTEEYINDVSKIKSFNIVDCKVSSTTEEKYRFELYISVKFLNKENQLVSLYLPANKYLSVFSIERQIELIRDKYYLNE